MTHNKVGVWRGKRREGWMEFTFRACSLRCPETKSIPAIFGKESSIEENIMKVEGKPDFTEDKWLLSDYVTHDPVFSTHTHTHTHTLRTCRLFQDGAFSCRVCSAPSWDSDDASFIAPKSSLEQRDSSTAGSHGERQLRCEMLSFKHNLFCGVAL